MATAPKPGARRKAEEQEKAQRVALKITLNGETRTLHMADLGPGDDLVARQQTGIPVMPYFHGERFAPDSLLVVWWMAGRKNGSPNLRFDDVLKEFPRWEDLNDAEVEEVTDGDDADEDAPEG